MAAVTRISEAAANAACNAVVDLLDVGGTGSVKIYSVGSGVPADVDTAITDQTLLAQLTLNATAFGAAAAGVATANAVTGDSSANDTGDAAFFRACKAAGTAVIQGTCAAADADMIMNTITIVSGGTVNINS